MGVGKGVKREKKGSKANNPEALAKLKDQSGVFLLYFFSDRLRGNGEGLSGGDWGKEGQGLKGMTFGLWDQTCRRRVAGFFSIFYLRARG